MDERKEETMDTPHVDWPKIVRLFVDYVGVNQPRAGMSRPTAAEDLRIPLSRLDLLIRYLHDLDVFDNVAISAGMRPAGRGQRVSPIRAQQWTLRATADEILALA